MSCNGNDNEGRRASSKTQASNEGENGRHVPYNLMLDTENLSPPPRVDLRQLSRSDTETHREINFSLILRRRTTSAPTFKTVDDYDEFDTAFSTRPGWQPSSEPGYDPMLPDANMVKRHFDNESFIEFLEQPRGSWAKCRWINVNGLSWDIIQAVGNEKNLHKLALEDMMNIRNRTKADWYPNHAFIVMTLQKLVHLVDGDDGSSDSSSILSRKSLGQLRETFQDFWKSRKILDPEKDMTGNGDNTKTPLGEELHETNEARTEFLERHSPLAPYKMAVSAEQVSADDVERPIVTRLSTLGTILRESNDAPLLIQAIIDAIIDLAIPITAVYTDTIAGLELDVLTSSGMNQSKSLYICVSETNKMLSFLNPIENLVNVLRDHKTYLTHEQALQKLENSSSGVIITTLMYTYLGDVLDHCIIITEALQQLKQSDNLINLIFNTISANQNESMKQLTIVMIIFLPLTFITGFFGQNFVEEGFPEIHRGIWYFWVCAVLTTFATVLILMRDMIYNWLIRTIQRKHIGSHRKKKRKRKL
ncbi:hypothetical protein EDB81DRAFT_927079 [Dactylonectria macrodidyma]|uniref:Uncharacterized protein n=1 Tax=Dactylonectria macrodidyma TaxID=307937 RepID=A0A9P9I778_9HYPO|nr:hypothetical protein EDB81DRAFT_927079 [Dactylonectria macrodidyma]